MCFRLGLSLILLIPTATARGQMDWSKRFEQHIRPILANRCLKCHGSRKQEGGLRLDTREALLKGGESGPAVIPGKPMESLLTKALRYESLEMPPDRQLKKQQILEMERWIAAGAPWPASGTIAAVRKIGDEDRKWWAFRTVTRPVVPELPTANGWSSNAVDRFVLRRMQQKGITPAPRADRETLIRRLYFDLIGLPPKPEEVEAFVNDTKPAAWERLVDRLLSDARYGEHWARFWLDLVRYSESDGWNQDAYRPHIWRYRDYVVQAFNSDKSYPQFVRDQLAGDEVSSTDPAHRVAAGFLRLGIYEYNQRDARGHWNDIMNEMTDVAGDVFFGMGMACARCHDHKFDPILQVDYFKLRAFFEPIEWRDDMHAATPDQVKAHKKKLIAWEKATQSIRDEIAKLIKPYHDKKWISTVEKFPLDIQACFKKEVDKRNSWEHQMAYLVSRQFMEEAGGPLKSMKKEDKARYDSLQKELAKFNRLKPKPLPQAMTVTDFAGQPAPTLIPDQSSDPIPPGFLTVLSKSSSKVPDQAGETTGRRTQLAKWIGSADNALTMRVIVNRVWQQHFGRGIVDTASDFGRKGQLPTHPELLDWLVGEFVSKGFSAKELTRTIVLSSTWRQSAHHPNAEAYQKLDPSENLLWRSPIRRLKAEQIRDAMLAISGELQQRCYGPSVDEKTPRRAIYVKTYRNKLDTFLHAFDLANGLKSQSERDNTTTPTQSLMMINGAYSRARAVAFAERIQHEPDHRLAISNAMFSTWGRRPSADELKAAIVFLTDKSGELDKRRLAEFCHVLFNSNAFLYLD